MSGVFRNIDPSPPHSPASEYPLAFGAGGGHTRWVERGWGVNSSEDARHCSVLYICKYSMGSTYLKTAVLLSCVYCWEKVVSNPGSRWFCSHLSARNKWKKTLIPLVGNTEK